MEILFYILPFIISMVAVRARKRFVNEQNGSKYALREFWLDVVRVFVITGISLCGYLFFEKKISTWVLFIDIIMLIVYSLPLIQKNYNYKERKALMGLLGVCIFMIATLIAITQMMMKTYDLGDTTIMFCFFKGVFYFLLGIWCCFTSQEENKFKALLRNLEDSKKNFSLTIIDYYTFAFMGLFITNGFNDYFIPVGVFGIHEILNKKVWKGITYIVLANTCLILEYYLPVWGGLALLIYTTVAFIDLIRHYIKYKKNK